MVLKRKRSYHVEMYALEDCDTVSYRPYTGDYCKYEGESLMDALKAFQDNKEMEGTTNIILWSYDCGEDFYEAYDHNKCKIVYEYRNKTTHASKCFYQK